VKVTLIEGRTKLLPFLDLEMGERLRSALVALGVDIRLGEQVKSVGRDKSHGIMCELESGTVLECDKLLAASGRSGRTEELNLASVGVLADKRGYVLVDGDYKTKAPNIYAA